METKKRSPAFIRQRKFMTVLPVLVLPFLLIIFVALGGGRGAGQASRSRPTTGINTILPDAHFKKGKEKDKLGVYEDATKDSAAYAEAMRKDPYYQFSLAGDDTGRHHATAIENMLKRSAAAYHQPDYAPLQHTPGSQPAAANEKMVMEKLEQLKKTIHEKSDPRNNNTSGTFPPAHGNGEIILPPGPEVRKLQAMMQMINEKPAGNDPEINQLNNMLDKVMLIQHPEKLQDSMKKLSEKNKAQAFIVLPGQPANAISELDSAEKPMQMVNAFYGLPGDAGATLQKQHAIEAIIPEPETLMSGATVKLRLLDDIFVNGIKIEKDAFVFGTASLMNERLRITVNSLRVDNNILPVSLSVYDMDGMEGIYIPGSINRDVSKQSADEAISTIGLTPADLSVGAQATAAGIQAAKTLASRKINLIRVSVPSGYKVLLRDNNQKNTTE